MVQSVRSKIFVGRGRVFMQLSKRNAEQIIQNINDILPQKINLMDLRGVIIASTDQQRVGEFHGGAARIIRENLDELRIFSDDEYEGSRKGTNFLLRVNDEPIGVLGITGSYEEILPFASVIKRMTELLVNEKEHQKQREFFVNKRTRFLMEWITHSEQVNKDFLKGCLLVFTICRWRLGYQSADNDVFVFEISIVFIDGRIIKHMSIFLKKKIKYAFIQHIFDLDKDSIMSKQMIYEFVHLVQFPYLKGDKGIVFA